MTSAPRGYLRRFGRFCGFGRRAVTGCRAAPERGADAVAVKELPELCSLDDGLLLAVAMLDQRVLVTENVSDFAPLGRTEEHVGLGEQPMQWWLSAPPPR